MAWLEFPIVKLLVITAIAGVGVFLAGVATRMLIGDNYSYSSHEWRGHVNNLTIRYPLVSSLRWRTTS